MALSCNISDDPEMDDEVSFLEVKEVTIDENKPEGSVDLEEAYE
ncbi:hypothetical protein AB6T38_11685 [Aliiglaciecola sp. SL4]